MRPYPRAIFLLMALTSQASAQDSRPLKGVPASATVRARTLSDRGFIQLINSFRVEAETTLGHPSIRIRIVSASGAWTGQDCDCRATQLYIVLNVDGDVIRGFSLPELLEPSLDPPVEEAGKPTLYVAYGLAASRRRLRIVIDRTRLFISPIASR